MRIWGSTAALADWGNWLDGELLTDEAYLGRTGGALGGPLKSKKVKDVEAADESRLLIQTLRINRVYSDNLTPSPETTKAGVTCPLQ